MFGAFQKTGKRVMELSGIIVRALKFKVRTKAYLVVEKERRILFQENLCLLKRLFLIGLNF